MDFSRKTSIFIIVLCILISLLYNQSSTTDVGSPTVVNFSPIVSSADRRFLQVPIDDSDGSTLRYDFYRDSCPLAEHIIRSTVDGEFDNNPRMAPALLRMVFHDCFVQGCDASILLDPSDATKSEQDSVPNKSLKGFEVIDTVKAKLEENCPGVVSCADIIVLSARESVIFAGGPFYPLLTGRRDSNKSFPDDANLLPGPDENLSDVIQKFAVKGFDERETVSLLGSHSTGRIQCKFMNKRLNGEHNEENPIDASFLESLRLQCNGSHTQSTSPFPSSSAQNLSNTLDHDDSPAINMATEGPGRGFGTLYFRGLLQNKGLLFADQQLIARDNTKIWVQAYASDASLFRRDFTAAMIKLSNLHVLTAPEGQIRRRCGEVN